MGDDLIDAFAFAHAVFKDKPEPKSDDPEPLTKESLEKILAMFKEREATVPLGLPSRMPPLEVPIKAELPKHLAFGKAYGVSREKVLSFMEDRKSKLSGKSAGATFVDEVRAMSGYKINDPAPTMVDKDAAFASDFQKFVEGDE